MDRVELNSANDYDDRTTAVPFARDDRAYDQLAGLAHDVAQHVVQLNIHLRQRLLQVLHAAPAVARVDDCEAEQRVRLSDND